MNQELLTLCKKAKAEVARGENYGLSFGTRKKVLRALGPVLVEDNGRAAEMGPGLIRRTRLCVSVVIPLLPLWDECYSNKAPQLMLELAGQYLVGKCTREDLRSEASDFLGGLANSDEPETHLAFAVGRASVCAAYVAKNDEILVPEQGRSEDDLLDPQDPDFWDCAFWAAAAAAGGMPWIDGFSKERYGAFWNHYLDIEVSAAWASVPE